MAHEACPKMLHSAMIDASEGESLVHKLQNKKRQQALAKRLKDNKPPQIIERTGPNTFRLRELTPDEIAAKAEADGTTVKQPDKFGWTNAVDTSDPAHANAPSSGDPVSDQLLFDQEQHAALEKKSKQFNRARLELSRAEQAVVIARRRFDALAREYMAARYEKALAAFFKTDDGKAARNTTAGTAVFERPDASLKGYKNEVSLQLQTLRSRSRKTALDEFNCAAQASSDDGLSQALCGARKAAQQIGAAEAALVVAKAAFAEAKAKDEALRSKLVKARGLQSRQRLQRDLVEVMKNRDSMPGIAAHPLEGNIYEWHCNILGAPPHYDGLVIHLVMTFSENYPHSPPRVRVCTPIRHINVFGQYICLDMLRFARVSSDWKNGPSSHMYTGWTRYVWNLRRALIVVCYACCSNWCSRALRFSFCCSGYSVLSILMQLQAFLLDPKCIRSFRRYGSANPSFYAADFWHLFDIASFRCKVCGHHQSAPSPAFSEKFVHSIPGAKDCRLTPFMQPWKKLYIGQKAALSWSVDSAVMMARMQIESFCEDDGHWYKPLPRNLLLWTLTDDAPVPSRSLVQLEASFRAALKYDLDLAHNIQRMAEFLGYHVPALHIDGTPQTSAALEQKAAHLDNMITRATRTAAAARARVLCSGVYSAIVNADVLRPRTLQLGQAWANGVTAASSSSQPSQPSSCTSVDESHAAKQPSLAVAVKVRSSATPVQKASTPTAVLVRIDKIHTSYLSGQIIGGAHDGRVAEVKGPDLFSMTIDKGECVMKPNPSIVVGLKRKFFITKVAHNVVVCSTSPSTSSADRRKRGTRSRSSKDVGQSRLQVGDKVTGTVTRHAHFGAFVKVPGWGREGLVHASACLRGVRHADYASLLPVDSEHELFVHSIDVRSGKLGLGIFPPESATPGPRTAAKDVVAALVAFHEEGASFDVRIVQYINFDQDALVELVDGKAARDSSRKPSKLRVTVPVTMLRTYAVPNRTFVWDVPKALPPGAIISVRVLKAVPDRKRFMVAPSNAAVFHSNGQACATKPTANSARLNFFERMPHKVLTRVWSLLGHSYSEWKGQRQLQRKDPNGQWYTFYQFVATYGNSKGGRLWDAAWENSALEQLRCDSTARPASVVAALRDCAALASTSKYLLHSSPRAAALHAQNTIRCFHTRKNHTQATLGFGLNLEFYPRLEGQKGPARLAYVHTTSDIISLDAFEAHGLRNTLWKTPFSHWFPAYIDDVHWHRGGRAAASKMLGRIFSVSLEEVKQRPELVLDLVPKVLNTMVLSMMKGISHASIAALHAYCQWAHILAGFCQEYPGVQKAIDDKIGSFISGEWGRNKYNCPALGEFLPLLLFTNRYNWAEVAADYLSETFDRNSKWILAQHPQLNNTENEIGRSNAERFRLGSSFACSQTSMRLLCFHVALLRAFDFVRFESKELDAGVDARFQLHPATEASVNSPTVRLKRYLDTTHGRSTTKLENALQKEIFKIQAIGKLSGTRWAEVFQYLGLPQPTDAYLASWLRASMRNSGRRNYHQREAMAEALEKQHAADRAARQRLKERLQKLDDGHDDNDQYYDQVVDRRSNYW